MFTHTRKHRDTATPTFFEEENLIGMPSPSEQEGKISSKLYKSAAKVTSSTTNHTNKWIASRQL